MTRWLGLLGVALVVGCTAAPGGCGECGGAERCCVVAGQSRCVDTARDAAHCGACGITCRTDQACTAGECVLAPRDAGAQPDATTDAGAVGDAAACAPACPLGTTCWCGACVRAVEGVSGGDGRLDGTFANCGACGAACDPERASRCGPLGSQATTCACGDGPPCPSGQACVTTSSGTSCAAPGCGTGPACPDGLTCVGGACLCGTVSCDVGENCVSGTCVCRVGGVPCRAGTVCSPADGCVDLSSDPNNCGFLLRACSPGESCVRGVCRGSCGAGASCGSCEVCCAGACLPATADRCASCAPCAAGDACLASVVGGPMCGRSDLPGGVCPLGAPRRCSTADCTLLDGPCALGVCDTVRDVCVARPSSNGVVCGASPGTCQERRCADGACTAVSAAECSACGAGQVCVAGTCGTAPASLGYDFEDGALPLGGATTGDAPWSVVMDAMHGGAYAARSGDVADLQISSWRLSVRTATDASLSFWYRVDSEAMYDWLELIVDDAIVDRWSGTVDWSEYRWPLSAGSHTLEWRYRKDRSVSFGADAAWIDDVRIDPTAAGTSLCGP